MRKSFLIALLVIEFFLIGCTAPKIRLFPSQADPLKEFTLEGKADQKVLVIPVRGLITNKPREGFIRTRPSMVQEVVSQLRLAEEDETGAVPLRPAMSSTTKLKFSKSAREPRWWPP